MRDNISECPFGLNLMQTPSIFSFSRLLFHYFFNLPPNIRSSTTEMLLPTCDLNDNNHIARANISEWLNPNQISCLWFSLSFRFLFFYQFVGYSDEITDLRYLNDDKHIAIATNSELLKIMNLETGTVQILTGHRNLIMSLAVCEHQHLLASGCKVWYCWEDLNRSVWRGWGC